MRSHSGCVRRTVNGGDRRRTAQKPVQRAAQCQWPFLGSTLDQVYDELGDGGRREHTTQDIANELGVARTTIYR